MSTIVNLADARARGIELPASDSVAQDILDEQEALLALRIGPLTGARTERFYVGRDPHGKLSLARYTAAVTVEDNDVAVDADHIRLIDRGSAVIQASGAPSRYWTGPYVEVAYTPSDELAVQSALYDLVALASSPASMMNSERIGGYSYSRNNASPASLRAAIISSLIPKRDGLLSLRALPRRLIGSAAINGPDYVDWS